MTPACSTLARATALALCVAGASTSALLWLRMATGVSACGLSGGCDVVQASSWARVLGIPLPVWGALYFTGVGAVLLRRAGWSTAVRGLLVVGAAGGATLLAVQLLVLGAVCPWCVCADVAAVGLGLLALAAPPLFAPGPSPRRWATAAAIAVVGLAPVTVVHLATAPTGVTSEPVADAKIDTPEPGDIATIVEFVDIQCPFCREQHARLGAILDEVGDDRIAVQVHHVPIAAHEHAREAAAIACCGEAQGKGRAILDALMIADDLSASGCRRTAAQAGLDLQQLDQCLQSDDPEQRLQRDTKAATEAGIRSLPTCVIGGRRLEGLQSPEDLRDAVDRALAATEGADCST